MRCAYAYDAELVSRDTGVSFLMSEDKALQSMKEECDINTLVKRFGITGELPSGVRAPTFGDFTGVMDYQSAQNALIAARAAFMEMPADVRARFANDPQKFVEFCSDEKNLEEMRKLGLAVPEKPKPDPVVMDVRIVNPEGSAPTA